MSQVTLAAEGAVRMPPDFIVDVINRINAVFPAVGVLLILMAVDVIVGFCAAWGFKEISSSVSHTGMVRKVVKILLVGVGAVLEPYTIDINLSKLTAIAFILTEVISIVENAARCGVPLPQVWIDVLEKLKNGDKKLPPPSSSQVVVNQAEKVVVRTLDSHDAMTNKTVVQSAKQDSQITRTADESK